MSETTLRAQFAAFMDAVLAPGPLRPIGATLRSGGPYGVCETVAFEDEALPVVFVGWFASDAACSREAARNGLNPADVMGFRDDRMQHPERSPK